MGCDNSKTTTKGQIIWIQGYPSSGKTFMADYLSTLGWENVDGDWISQEADPKVIAKYEGMEEAIQA